MTLPTPTTATEIYLAAIHKQQGEILTELRSRKPTDLSEITGRFAELITLMEPKPEPIPAPAVELKEPKRKAK